MARRIGWLYVRDVFVQIESEAIVEVNAAYGLRRIRVLDFKQDVRTYFSHSIPNHLRPKRKRTHLLYNGKVFDIYMSVKVPIREKTGKSIVGGDDNDIKSVGMRVEKFDDVVD